MSPGTPKMAKDNDTGTRLRLENGAIVNGPVAHVSPEGAQDYVPGRSLRLPPLHHTSRRLPSERLRSADQFPASGELLSPVAAAEGFGEQATYPRITNKASGLLELWDCAACPQFSLSFLPRVKRTIRKLVICRLSGGYRGPERWRASALPPARVQSEVRVNSAQSGICFRMV